MGITIHYSGKLDDSRTLPQLLDAARLFCSERGWTFQNIDDRVVGTVERWIPSNDEEIHTESRSIDDTQRGILINPHPESETITLIFNQQHELCFYTPLQEPGQYWETKLLFTKTQFAPIDIHIGICELLHLIQDKYFPSLDVHDEGEYFETRDRERLAHNIGFLDAAMNHLETALKDTESPIANEIQSALDSIDGSETKKAKRKKGFNVERGKKISVRDPLWKQTGKMKTSKN